MFAELSAVLSNAFSEILIKHAHAGSFMFDPHGQVETLVSEAATMQQDIQNAAKHGASLELTLATLQLASESLLKDDASSAMDALLVLVYYIEDLHQHVQEQKASALVAYHDPTSAFEDMQARAPLVNACKLQSRVVFNHFRLLHQQAKSLTERFNELATEFTFQISLSRERIERVQTMMQTAEVLRDGAERERESWQGRRAVAETHIQQARETIQVAESKRDSMESARVVRNLLTFGIGEVFDFFDLNEDIEHAEQAIASAERNARACGESIQRANDALNHISAQVARLGELGYTVHDQETTLHASVVHGQGVRTRTLELTNASLDVSLFVGKLAAKSETFAVHHTAQEFAQSVLGFGRLMVSDGKLNDALIQHDMATMQEVLDMIAQSDDVEDGWSLEAPQPWLAIDDMM